MLKMQEMFYVRKLDREKKKKGNYLSLPEQQVGLFHNSDFNYEKINSVFSGLTST